MSPSRFAPAVRQHPNPPHPHQMTPWPTFGNGAADPSDSAGSSTNDANGTDTSSPSRSSARKMKGRVRQERPAEEDIRFNIGPKSPRAMLARRLMRRARPERVIDPYTLDIPDYPPPSFQEAMSSTPVPISPTATITQASLAPQEVEASSTSNNSQEDIQDSIQRTSVTSDSDSSSDSSHGFITVPRTRDDVPQRDFDDDKDNESQGVLTFPSPLRGRTKSRGILDDDPDEEDDHVVQSAAATTRRHNSLSPLRTLFPSLRFTLHDHRVPASAHPTTEPASSPYPPSRSISFFRSATSLALFNGGDASGCTTPTLKTKASMNTLLQQQNASPKRKLFGQSKLKDRMERSERSERPEKLEIDPGTPDEIENWEVIDAKDADGASEEKTKEKNKMGKGKGRGKERDTGKQGKKGTRRASTESVAVPTPEPLIAQVAPLPSAAPSSPSPKVESPRTPSPLIPQAPIQEPQLQPHRQENMHFLSLLDRKGFIPSVEFTPSPQTTPPMRPVSPSVVPTRAPQPHEPQLPVITKTLNNGPSAAAVRCRQNAGSMQPLVTQRSQVFNNSPLANAAFYAGQVVSPISPVETIANDPSLMSALYTPLPPSPVESDRTIPLTLGNGNTAYRGHIAEIMGLEFTRSIDSYVTAPDTMPGVGGCASRAEAKHYHGRPLPHAPGPAGLYVPPTPPQSEKNEVPLIDLEDNTFTPQAARSQVDLSVSGPPMPGYPVIGYGHGHCGHLAPASISTPSLSQPIYPASLHVVSMSPSQRQGGPAHPVWPSLYTIATVCGCGMDHKLEPSPYWQRLSPPSPKESVMKMVPPSSQLAQSSPHHVHPCALSLARAQTHPSTSSSSGMCM